MSNIIILSYATWNIIVCIIYGIDKLLAKLNTFRIPEKTLIFLAEICGALGAMTGMRFFHHKTRHSNFVPKITILAFVQLALLFFILQGIDK